MKVQALMKPKALIGLALGGSLLLGGPWPPLTGEAGAAPRTRTSAKKNEPIKITSNRMEANSQKNIIVFIGKVLAVQGDMRIQSDRLEVYTQKSQKGKKASRKKTPSRGRGADARGSVERIVAIGNVLLNQSKTKFASGDRLDYNEKTGIAILTGNPRAWDGKNQIVGNKIELYLKEDRTVVLGTRKRRVSVTLFPEEDTPRGRGNNAR